LAPTILKLDIMRKLFQAKKITYFKKWTRKHYAILKSFSKVIKICFLSVIYTIINSGNKPASAQADTNINPKLSYDYNIDEVEVIGRKGSVAFSEVARAVLVIQHEDIAQAPVHTLNELLEFISNVDIKQRGMQGVQADIAIRGGSFDHVLILLNGINFSDPQTGHFNLDLPIDPVTIQRIEILNGPAARVYGSGAFTGAINIIVKPDYEKYVKAILSAGEFGFKKFDLTFSAPLKSLNNIISIGHSDASGYADNTDFSIQQLYYSGIYYARQASISMQAGHKKKAFGANGFYTPKFPEQYEESNASLASVSIKTSGKPCINTSAYWRKYSDHFMLKRDSPEFYQNYHINNIFGSLINGQVTIGKTRSLFGVELRAEDIISTRLGLDNIHPVRIKNEDSLFYNKKYNRTNFSYFQEHIIDLGKLSITAGYLINWVSDYPIEPAIFPGIDISYSVTGSINTFLSLNRTVRHPSFTDMFYTDPSHVANIYLEPDRMTSIETGIHINLPIIKASAAIYKAYGKNIIEWLWNYSKSSYSPVNVNEVTTTGIEINAKIPLQKALGSSFPVQMISFSYSYLDIQKSIPDSVSKYYNLKNKLNVSFFAKIFGQLYSTWQLSYQQRMGSYIQYDIAKSTYFSVPYQPYILVNGSVSWNEKSFSIFLEASNIFNTCYIDAGSLQQPGRWITGGIKINLDFENKRKKASFMLN
jgi:iron complex outermembrane receptor protein